MKITRHLITHYLFRIVSGVSGKRFRTLRLLLTLSLLFLMITDASAAVTSVIAIVNCIICRLVHVMWGVVGALATIMMVLAGLRWIGSESDPGQRAAAKSSIMHAMVGVIICIVAVYIVGWLTEGLLGDIKLFPADAFIDANCEDPSGDDMAC